MWLYIFNFIFSLLFVALLTVTKMRKLTVITVKFIIVKCTDSINLNLESLNCRL